MLTNQVEVLNDILVRVAIRGDAAFVQAILDYDRTCLFNLGIDLNPAGIQITNSLRTMRLTRELRSIYKLCKNHLSHSYVKFEALSFIPALKMLGFTGFL